jgi:hypothetical protein
MLTISLGVLMHTYRVIFGDTLTLQHVVTVTTDRILLVPMTYAAITGILVYRRVRFANRRHQALFTGSVVYIAGSVPLHVYLDYVIRDVSFVTWFPMWFSYLLLIAVYPAARRGIAGRDRVAHPLHPSRHQSAVGADDLRSRRAGAPLHLGPVRAVHGGHASARATAVPDRAAERRREIRHADLRGGGIESRAPADGGAEPPAQRLCVQQPHDFGRARRHRAGLVDRLLRAFL